jgi:hypothetical protein
MKEPHLRNSVNAVTMLATLCLASVAVAQTLPIRPGVYVLEASKCEDAPNAAIIVWDGIGFSGAHSGRCISHIGPLPNGRYQVSTKCTALGDGTPDTAGAHFEDVMTIDHVSSGRFTVIKATGARASYRWCSAK